MEGLGSPECPVRLRDVAFEEMEDAANWGTGIAPTCLRENARALESIRSIFSSDTVAALNFLNKIIKIFKIKNTDKDINNI